MTSMPPAGRRGPSGAPPAHRPRGLRPATGMSVDPEPPPAWVGVFATLVLACGAPADVERARHTLADARRAYANAIRETAQQVEAAHTHLQHARAETQRARRAFADVEGTTRADSRAWGTWQVLRLARRDADQRAESAALAQAEQSSGEIDCVAMGLRPTTALATSGMVRFCRSTILPDAGRYLNSVPETLPLIARMRRAAGLCCQDAIWQDALRTMRRLQGSEQIAAIVAAEGALATAEQSEREAAAAVDAAHEVAVARRAAARAAVQNAFAECRRACGGDEVTRWCGRPPPSSSAPATERPAEVSEHVSTRSAAATAPPASGSPGPLQHVPATDSAGGSATWWCSCFRELAADGEERDATGCRASREQCLRLERAARGEGSRAIIAGGLRRECTAVQGDPATTLGGEGWRRSDRAGAWACDGRCALP